MKANWIPATIIAALIVAWSLLFRAAHQEGPEAVRHIAIIFMAIHGPVALLLALWSVVAAACNLRRVVNWLIDLTQPRCLRKHQSHLNWQQVEINGLHLVHCSKCQRGFHYTPWLPVPGGVP